MSIRVKTGALPGTPEARISRGSRADGLAVMSLITALYLLLALTVPEAHRIAYNAADALYEARVSAGQLTNPVGHSPTQLANGEGEQHYPGHASKHKRLRGTLESASSTTIKVLGVIFLYDAPKLRSEDPGAAHRPAFLEREPEQPNPPPQLLQRPPPGN